MTRSTPDPRPMAPHRRRSALALILLLWLALPAIGRPINLFGFSTAPGALEAAQLRCEYRENPLGLDALQPRLSWIVQSDERNQRQSAYQILVTSSAAKLWHDEGDLWDSGKVPSDQTLHVEYAGQPLRSRQGCFWKVRVWDRDDKISEWSAPAYWEMGLLKPGDWSAQWIGRTTETNYTPAPLLRTTFTVDGDIDRARLYVCGLGYCDLYLNGERVGDQILDPGYTRYDKRVLYATHDVAPQLRPGRNALGVMLGTGWYNCHTKAVWDFHQAPWRSAPKLLLQLVIDYKNGRSQTIHSQPQWKAATGPILFDSIYGGETWDARLEKAGWTAPGYDDGDWEPALAVEPPRGRLVAQTMPAIRITRKLKPSRITEPKPGVFVGDFGQNLAGRVELNVKGPRGTQIAMRYGERLHPDGSLDTEDIAQHVVKKWPEQQFQTDTYILNGQGRERWHSRFTYHGFQYVEITGWPGEPQSDELQALFNHTAVKRAGAFECSHPLFSRIQEAADWAYLSNLQSIPTDCPHREKNGWTGDAHLAAEQALFNFFPPAVYTKWIDDLADEQQPTGELPGIVPTSGWGYAWGNGPAWDSAFLLIPYYLHLYYADTRILTTHRAGFQRYVDYLTGKTRPDGTLDIGLNDWAPFETQTGAPITSTAYYYVDSLITAQAARLAGDPSTARRYTDLAQRIKHAFNARFYRPDIPTYDNGSQTALSCALYQGLVEPGNTLPIVDQLVAAVARRNGHIDAGILGAKYLLNTLLEHGRADVAYQVAAQTNLPGWGWWIEQGATTLWEQWKGSESRNHIMFGDISAWFYKAIAGIQPDPDAPGFKHFTVRPHVLGNLTWARARYHSIRGLIRSEWRLHDDRFELRLTVPANTTASVYLPVRLNDGPQVDGKPLGTVPGIRWLPAHQELTAFRIGSGDYTFTGPWNRR